MGKNLMNWDDSDHYRKDGFREASMYFSRVSFNELRKLSESENFLRPPET